jgi:hypothetical protein
MRGEILGPVASAIGGAILPRGAGAGTLLWSIAGTTQIAEEAANATYTVSYSNALSPGQSATIAVASAAGTATDGVDYTGVATTMTFTAGGTTAKTVAVTIIEDTIVESVEDFRVTLTNPSTGQLATSWVNTTIADEDGSLLAWNVSGPTSIDEGDAGTFTVGYAGATLAPGQQATVTVGSASSALSWPDADAGSDYTALSTVLTFTGGGMIEKTVSVSSIDDTEVEGTEDFRVTIGGQSAGTLGTSQANTLIVSEDVEVLLADAVSGAVQAYSMRKLRAAYAGDCLRLRRSSDNAEDDFGFDGNGNLDTAAIASWLGGADGFVVTWYDQSGNAKHIMQATAGNQPNYLASWHNSLPGVQFVPANSTYLIVDITTALQHTMFMVAESKAVTSGEEIIVSQTGHPIRFVGYSDFTTARAFTGVAGNSSTLPTDRRDPHLLEFQRSGDGSAAAWWQDGTMVGTPTINTNTCHLEEFGRNSTGPGSNKFDGVIAEFVSFEPNLSGGDRGAAEADIMTYWGL